MMTRQFGPYVLVAALCAGLNVAIMIAGDRQGLHYALSTSLSFVACVITGYALHSRWTFRAPAKLQGLARYTLAMSINYPLSLASVWAFYSAANLPMTFAAPLATAATIAVNFALSRWAIVQPAGARK